jgi:1-acyl-sn-glycerol-3-phosphate acyltransferase
MWHPRTLFRLLRVALHLLQGCLTVALVYPCLSEKNRLGLKRRWSRQLLAMLGVRLRYQNPHNTDLEPTLPHGLVVSNHISFLDIFVVNAIAPTAFVSKHDVRGWPLIGWLSEHTDTLFLERGNRNAAQRARENLAMHLKHGKRVALFPEGTTTRGDTLLPFHSALFQAAIDAGTTVTPLALRYRAADGGLSSAPAYVDDISLLECMRRIAGQKTLYAEVIACSSLLTTEGDRRKLSAQAHQMVVHSLYVENGRMVLREAQREAQPETELSPPMAPVPAG